MRLIALVMLALIIGGAVAFAVAPRGGASYDGGAAAKAQRWMEWLGGSLSTLAGDCDHHGPRSLLSNWASCTAGWHPLNLAQVPLGDALHMPCEYGRGFRVHARQRDHASDDDVADLGLDVRPGVRIALAGVLPRRTDDSFGDFARLFLDLEQLQKDALFARERGVALQAVGKARNRLPGISHVRLISVSCGRARNPGKIVRAQLGKLPMYVRLGGRG